VIVIDSSSLAKYLLREEGWRDVEQYLQKGVLTLDHAKKEVLNAVWKHSKIRHVITEVIAEKLHNTLNQLIDAKVLIVEEENIYVDEDILGTQPDPIRFGLYSPSHKVGTSTNKRLISK